MPVLHVDPSNADQLAAWDGDEGAYWAKHDDYFDRSIAAHHEPFLAAAQFQPNDRVLDIGCGTGKTTRDAGRAAPSGSALGVDLSARMLDRARDLAAAERLTNVSFLQADAQVHAFDRAAFDVVISRTGAMFFGDHPAAFSNIRRALRQNGRLVLLTWRPLTDNEWLREIATALAAGGTPRVPPPGAGPFSLSEPDRVQTLLAEAGFTGVSVVAHDAPMWFGHDGRDAYEFLLGLLGWMLRDLDEPDRTRARETLLALATDHETATGVTFGSGAWIITAHAP